jgi:hypothetical protein
MCSIAPDSAALRQSTVEPLDRAGDAVEAPPASGGAGAPGRR